MKKDFLILFCLFLNPAYLFAEERLTCLQVNSAESEQVEQVWVAVKRGSTIESSHQNTFVITNPNGLRITLTASATFPTKDVCERFLLEYGTREK